MRGRWPARIKSAAYYTKGISLVNGAGSSTQSITAVDLTRAIVIPSGHNSQDPGLIWWSCGFQLTDATTITLTHYGSATYSKNVAMQVLEFWKPPRSIQWVAGGAASRTLGAALLDYTKAWLFSCNYGEYIGEGMTSAELVSNTQVNFINATYSDSGQLRWCVVEF